VLDILNKQKTKEKKMKVSKIILASLLGAVMINGAFADEFDGPRNRCKAKSDKIWVERTHECIPTNPCKDSKYEEYCNRAFKDYQSPGGTDLYIYLIDFYAESHNLSCKAVPQDSSMFGQDYVVCQGTDVMVFEFDDINNYNIWSEYHPAQRPHQKTLEAICTAAGGSIETISENKEICKMPNYNSCPTTLKEALAAYKKVNVGWEVIKIDLEGEDCRIVVDTMELDKAINNNETLVELKRS